MKRFVIYYKKDKSEESTYPTVDLNELKLNIIHGNVSEINKAKKELEKLKAELASYLRAYCKRYHRITVTIDYRKIDDTNEHSLAGHTMERIIKGGDFKCICCGETMTSS